MNRRIDAPWSGDIVDRLNIWQSCGFVHEYTCPECKIPLQPTKDGWICIGKRNLCSYKQTWAHEPPTVEEFENRASDLKEFGFKL